MNNSKFIKRTICAFLAAAMLVSSGGCAGKNGGSSSDSASFNQPHKIVNYFIPSEFEMPESIGYTENIFYANDKVYLIGQANGDEGEKYSQIFNMDTKETKDVDFSVLNAQYLMNAEFVNGKIIALYYDEEYTVHMAALDAEKGGVICETVFDAESYPASVKEDSNGNIEVLRIKWGMTSSESSIVTYDSSTLKEISNTELTEKLGLNSDESVSADVRLDDGSYLFLTIKFDYQTGEATAKVIRTDADLNVVYTVDDFSDMEGFPDNLFKLANGNICLSSTDDGSMYFFNEIDIESGAVKERYECDLGQGGVYFIPSLKPEGADIAYKTNDGIYSLSVSTGKTAKMYSIGSDIASEFADSTCISCSGNSLLMHAEVYGGAGTSVFMFDTDGNELGTIPVPADEEENVMNAVMRSDGKLCLLKQRGETEETDGDYVYKSYFSVVVLNDDGSIDTTLDLSEVTEGRDDMYIQQITAGADGDLYLFTNEYSQETGQSTGELIIVDSTGKIKNRISSDDMEYPVSAIVSENGNYIMYENHDYNIVSAKFDPATGEIGEKADFDIPNSARPVQGDDRYDFTYMTSEGVYGFDAKTKKSAEIINWVDSDINDEIISVALAGDDRMFCLMYNYDDGSNKISILRRADEEKLKEIQNKTIITVAGMDISYNTAMQDRILDFNKNSEKYRIQINDYDKFSTYEDDTYKSGAFKLNNDIASGSVPDIIVGNSEVDMTSFAAKGVLADLNTFIENDPDIKKENYFENIFDIYSYNGKLCQLVTNYSLLTLVGKSSVVGKEPGWNYDEFFALADKGNMFYKTNKTELQDLFIKRNLSEYVDFENKTCDFNNDNFIKLLELIEKEGTDPEDEDMGIAKDMMDNDSEYYARYKNDLCKVESLNMYGFFRLLDIQQGAAQEAVTLKGFPSKDGNGSLVAADATFGICEKSANKDAAWEFLREFMLEEYQDQLNSDYTYTFPVMKSAFEKAVNKSMAGEEQGYSVTDPDGQRQAMNPLDSETAEMIRNVISNANRALVMDERIGGIIDEQLAKFTAGEQSAAETAETIQSKASIYLKEIK